ncbi:hypothetical protein JCM14635_39990 [Megalodesulfovibrio paquesii]
MNIDTARADGLMAPDNARQVKAWMVRHNVNRGAIAAELGVTPQMVSAVIWGRSDSRRVIEHLLRLGCPRKCFRGTKYEQCGLAA